MFSKIPKEILNSRFSFGKLVIAPSPQSTTKKNPTSFRSKFLNEMIEMSRETGASQENVQIGSHKSSNRDNGKAVSKV